MKILSRQSLRELVQSEPKVHDAVVIHEVGNYADVADIVANCRNAVVLEMDDIVSDRAGSPTLEQVKKAVDSGYEIVACKQGISRSSAIAFLIKCKTLEPEMAIEILNPKRHYPNELIMKHGLEVIGEQIRPVVKEFYKKFAKERGWKWEPHNIVTKFFRD